MGEGGEGQEAWERDSQIDTRKLQHSLREIPGIKEAAGRLGNIRGILFSKGQRELQLQKYKHWDLK